MFISNSRPSNLGVGVSALILKTCMQCKRQSANVHHWSSLHIPFHSLSFFSVALPYLKCYYFTSAYVLNIYIYIDICISAIEKHRIYHKHTRTHTHYPTIPHALHVLQPFAALWSWSSAVPRPRLPRHGEQRWHRHELWSGAGSAGATEDAGVAGMKWIWCGRGEIHRDPGMSEKMGERNRKNEIKPQVYHHFPY